MEALADLREDVGEDEDEQERLHDRPDQELAEVAAQDTDVAGEQRAEGLEVRPHSRYSRPVRLRKTVSRLGGRLEASRTGRPSSAAACTSWTRTPSERAACTRTSVLVPLDLDRADAVEPLGALGERRGISLHGQRDQRLGAVPPLQLGGRVDGERLAVVDDRDPLAQLVGLLHVVRREQRRLPGAVEVLEDPPEVDPRLGVDAGGRLVEEEHPRLVHERAGHHQPLRETAREVEDHRVGALGERELLEQLVGSRPGAGARDAEEAAVVVEVLPDGERAVERVRLRDDADLALHVGGVAADVEAGDERAPAGRDDGRREHPDRRRLARAVRAEQAEELAAPHLEVEPVDGDERPVDLAELLGPDRRVPHAENVSHRPDYNALPPGVCPSGQRERAVNPSAQPTEVRILPPPFV